MTLIEQIVEKMKYKEVACSVLRRRDKIIIERA